MCNWSHLAHTAQEIFINLHKEDLRRTDTSIRGPPVYSPFQEFYLRWGTWEFCLPLGHGLCTTTPDQITVPLMFSLQQKQYFLLSQEYWLSSFWNYFKFSSHNSRDTVSWPPLSTVKISFNMLTWLIVSWKWCFWIITVNLYLSTRTK